MVQQIVSDSKLGSLITKKKIIIWIIMQFSIVVLYTDLFSYAVYSFLRCRGNANY